MFTTSRCITVGFVFLWLPLLGCMRENEVQQNSQNNSLVDITEGVHNTQDNLTCNLNRFDGEVFDRLGFDCHGFNKEGFDSEGFNKAGFDRYGFNREGFGRRGFNRLGFDRDGFDREGFNRYGFNRVGFDRYGYNAAGFDRYGFDKDGYNRFGFNRVGFDRHGFNRSGLNRHGFTRAGFIRRIFNGVTYNQAGFNVVGFDRNGFNWEGFDHKGFNSAGIDCHGFNRNRLRVQYPRVLWARKQQGEQMVWSFDGSPLLVGGSEFQEDQIIRQKTNQLKLFENQNPAQFIHIINQNAHRLNERFLDKIAESILNFQDSWNQMNPDLEQVIQLASIIPGITEIQNRALWELKKNALERELVQNVDDFQHLLGVVPEDLVQNLYFLEARTNWFINSLPTILSQEKLNYRDIKELKTLTENMRFYPAFNQQKNVMISLIDQALVRKREEFPTRELEILDARVRALYHEVKPVSEGHSKFKFYLTRNETEWKNDRFAHENAPHEEPCLFCTEELNDEHPGVICPMHPQIAYHASENCLIPYIRHQIGEQKFPITCGDLDQPHELPITERLLRNAGLEEQHIRAWKIQTLRSYYAELIRLQNSRLTQAPSNTDPKFNSNRDQICCATPDCGAIIFSGTIRTDTQTHVCEVCAVERCHLCGKLPHRGRECGRAEGEIMPPYHSRYRPCPYCLIITEREAGCNSIKCQNANCRKEWHFNLGKPRRRSFLHDFELDVNYPRLREYCVPGDPDYVEGLDMECAFPDNQGEIMR